MKMKKTVIALGAAMILGLTGCGGQTQVNVEQAGMLATAATSSAQNTGFFSRTFQLIFISFLLHSAPGPPGGG